MRFFRVVALALSLLSPCAVLAQSGNAAITGIIEDPSKAVVPGVSITAINTDTGEKITTTTNRSGQYSIPALVPGPYRLEVDKQGFRGIIQSGLILHTQDIVQLNFHMAIGSSSETVTVSTDENNINTTNASVETVINRQFVQEIPMNGRSFQTLILLSPGVVTGSPQATNEGEFSVNGMRTDSNNFSVDGLSVNNQASNAASSGTSGMLPSETALGTTHSILSIDAMEEFKISTSTYSAEYGRQPGAQISFKSRSGTNEYHGLLFEYLRNSAFDANNWFNTYGAFVPTPAERQNDFGGTLGGPISIPYLYSGKDRTFFFFSYEGLRVSQPLPVAIYYVPSDGTHLTGDYSAHPTWADVRDNAMAAVQPLWKSWPKPNCSLAEDPQCVDYVDGASPYRYSPPSTALIDSINARIDYQILPSMRLFARYNDTPSDQLSGSGGGPTNTGTTVRNRIYALGLDNVFGGAVSSELRLQYSQGLDRLFDTPYAGVGGTPLDLFAIEGLPPNTGESYVGLSEPSSSKMYQLNFGGAQFQPNAVETVTWSNGRHLFKAGADYRQTTAYYGWGTLSRGPFVRYTYKNAAVMLSNTPATTVNDYQRTDPTFKNLGLYIQDEWRIQPRVSLSMGLRWDVNPPPSISGSKLYTYTGNINDPSSLALSAPGAPLYKTTYTGFAPRLGAAITLHQEPGHETVLRVGGGLFNELISLHAFVGQGSNLGGVYTATYSTFPVTVSQIYLAPQPPAHPYTLVDMPNNRLVPPYAFQWNTTLEQALGKNQSLTVGYVGSAGRKLIALKSYSIAKLNPLFTTLSLYSNGPGSNYNSLQVKYQRQMSRGFQVLASYTWAHSIDWASGSFYSSGNPLQRGNSDNDVRQNFTASAVYNLPKDYKNGFEKTVLGYWNASLWFVARSAFPYEPVGQTILDPATGDEIYSELDYNSKNPYVYKAGVPGGRQVDPTVFSETTDPLGVGNAPRNFLRGFGEDQVNLSIDRDFPIYERLKLQFRAEAFNIANHPSFGTINNSCTANSAGTCANSLMGQATSTLSGSLNGLTSLYQQGGPRSLEFALRLQF